MTSIAAHGIAFAGVILFPLMASWLGIATEVEGTVLEDHSGAPVAAALVAVKSTSAPGLVVECETDAKGRFVAPRLPPGGYDGIVQKWSYAATRVSFGLPEFSSVSSAPTVGAGTRAAVMSLTIRLVRFGAISGHVTDPLNRPVGGALVYAMVRETERSPLIPFNRPSIVDEGGKYRIYNLPPGHYAVAAKYANLATGAGSGLSFYPGTTDPQVLAVAGGEEHSGIDIRIPAERLSRIGGTVRDSGYPGRFVVSLVRADQSALPVATQQTSADGGFLFEAVPPGSYSLLASGPVAGWGSPAVLGPKPRFGRIQVNVAGQDVQEVSVPVLEGQSFSLTLRYAGSGRPPVRCPATLDVILAPVEAWGAHLDRKARLTFTTQSFVSDLPPGPYSFDLGKVAEGCYWPHRGAVELTAGAGEPRVASIQIDQLGSIRGRLKAASPPDARYVVVLTSADPLENSMPVQAAYADQESRFGFSNLRPGRYHIGALLVADAARGRWFPSIEGSVEIEVSGGASTDLDLPVREANKSNR